LFGPDAVAVGGSLSDLAITLRREGKLQDAETMLRKGLSIDLKNNRTEDAAADEHNLGVLRRFEKRPAEAEAMLRSALAAHLQTFGVEHPSTAQTMNQLAYALHDEGSRPRRSSMLASRLRHYGAWKARSIPT
jgi:Tetratricopeptide repeat